MNYLTMESITKSYGIKNLFNKLSFGIQEGDRIGLVGVNGTGKSTLLKMVAGIIEPDSGTRTVNNQITIEYLAQNPEFDEKGTVLDQIFTGTTPLIQTIKEYEETLELLNKDPNNNQLQKQFSQLTEKMDALAAWDVETNAKAILTRLGITNFTDSIQNLSGGQRKRIAMAKALINPADLLILDEPTNHIDHETVEWLENYLSHFKGALLLITHDRYFLDRVVNHIIELDHGNLYEYEGNYSLFLEKKAERMEQEAASEDKRQNLLRRELAWLRRGAKARTTKQKARIDRIHQLQEGPEKRMDGTIEFGLKTSRLGKKIIELDGISASYEGRVLFQDFSYIAVPGDRIGIVGPNGSGKSTLLKIMTGELLPSAGTVTLGETVKFGYYKQENEELDGSMRVIDYIKEAGHVIHLTDGKTLSASQLLERFLFPPALQWSTIDRLSGGEKRRLYLLRVLMGEPNVLFLDEPTNDLDIQTLSILEDFLEQFPGVVYVVSHDRYFLDRTVDELFVFENGNLSMFTGNYSDYIEKKRTEAKPLPTPVAPQKKEDSSEKGKKAKTKLSFKEQREFDTIEDEIGKLEEKLVQLDEEMVKYANDYVKLQELTREKETTEKTLEEKIERWSELTMMIEEFKKN